VNLPRIDPLELGRLAGPFDHDEWLFETLGVGSPWQKIKNRSNSQAAGRFEMFEGSRRTLTNMR
jgi:hypothetical protein